MKVGLAAEYLARSVLMMLLIIIASIGYFGQTMPSIQPVSVVQELIHVRHMSSCMSNEWLHGQTGSSDITLDGSIFLRDGVLSLTLSCGGHWKTYFDTSDTTCINWNNVYPPPPHQEMLQGQVIAAFPPHLPYKKYGVGRSRIVCFGTRYDQQ